MSEPAYTRLDVDERRRRLLEHGAELFARHSYDELSMAGLARAAGVSKALLYHYFPSKQAYFSAVLAEGAAELASVVAVDAPPAEQLDAFLALGRAARRRPTPTFVRGAAPEVRDVMELIRGHTAERIFAAPRRRADPAAPHRGARRGCGSWTARSSTGSSTATSSATPSGTCCCERSRERSASRSSPA